jgi:endonuclease YncB( thermonuclease family)
MRRELRITVVTRILGCCSIGIALLLTASCIDSFFASDGSMPAPLREDFPYEISGIASSQFMGDSFPFNTEGTLHFIILKGVDTPRKGQPFYKDARRSLRRMIKNKTIRVEVVERDAYHCEIGFAICSLADDALKNDESLDVGCDVGLQLIRLGLGWYDGADFEDADLYRAAEQEARNARRGLWEQEDPVPPWEHES